MKPTAWLWIVLALAVFPPPAPAQKRPDFSGAWKAVQEPPVSQSERRGALGSGWGDEFFVKQDEQRLTIERAFFTPGDLQPVMRFRYALDGSETSNAVMMGRGVQEDFSTASWDGDKLVIRSASTVDPGDGQSLKVVVTRTLSLRPAALPAWEPSLVVETKRSTVRDGLPSTTRTVYARQ